MRFEWDSDKNRRNIAKHGVSFEDACRIFEGVTVDWLDDRFDYVEVREISIGMLDGIALVAVAHTDRNGVCRIISARQANKKEKELYDKTLRKTFER